MLRMLHLSDIHFTNFLRGHEDLDLERTVREKLLVDLGHLRDRLGPFDTVLLVGDIGSRGKPEDYRLATDFLDGVIDLVGCATDRVVCVPGNHDVDRDLQGPVHATIRHQLRSIEHRKISDVLLNLLRDPTGAEILLAPLNAYNDFALAYGCDLSAAAPVWAPKFLSLGDKTLFLHGITSAWVSDASDDSNDDAMKLVVGSFQLASLAVDPNTVSITLCHHPPRWLRDAEDLAPWVASAQVVLTGHEHEAGIHLSPDKKTLYVSSGAVNPARGEVGWVPAYNVLEMDLPHDTPDSLLVRVHARRWQDRAEFGPDPDYPDPLEKALPLRDRLAEAGRDPNLGADGVPPAGPLNSAIRSMAHAVMRASPDRRRRAARELGILTGTLPEGLEADRELIRAAIETDRVAELAARNCGRILR